jgi:hypothetical protein
MEDRKSRIVYAMALSSIFDPQSSILAILASWRSEGAVDAFANRLLPSPRS